jgi:hypothetical protein
VTLLAASSSSVAAQVTPGLLGFLVVAGLGVAVYFLFRSLNKQLKKISPDPRVRASVAKKPRSAQPAQPAQSSSAAPGGNSKP